MFFILLHPKEWYRSALRMQMLPLPLLHMQLPVPPTYSVMSSSQIQAVNPHGQLIDLHEIEIKGRNLTCVVLYTNTISSFGSFCMDTVAGRCVQLLYGIRAIT